MMNKNMSLIDDAQNMQNELSMGTWPIYKNDYDSLVRKMAWYKILTS